MSFKEIIFNVKNIIRGGRQSDDDPISDRQLAFIINYLRSYMVNKYLMEKRSIRNCYQQIPCLEMELGDKSQCCDYFTDCLILRTVKPLPKLINSIEGIRYYGLIDGQRTFGLATNLQARYSQYNRYNSKPKMAYLGNDYRMYITNEIYLEVTTILALFENPYEAINVNKCENNCIDIDELTTYWDLPYPVEQSMLIELNRLVLDKELRIMALSKLDPKNDDRQDRREDSSTV